MKIVTNRTILLTLVGLVSNLLIPISMAFGESAGCIHHYRIGVVLSLTGGPSSSGEGIKNSILLARQRFDSGNCVDFRFEDDQFQPKNTVIAVSKLLEVDRVDGVIVYGTPTSLAVTERLEREKVPMVALSILDRVVQGKQFVMKHWCTAERLNESVIQEVRKRGYKKVAIISTVNDAMLKLRDLYKKSAISEVVVDEEVNKDDLDFNALALKLKHSGADAIYLLLYPPQTGLFVKRFRQIEKEIPLFGVHNAEDSAEVAVSEGAMFGMWLANADDKTGENYYTTYLEHYAKTPTLGGGSGFDVAKMIIEGAHNSKNLNDYLHSIRNFSGAFGVYDATSDNDFNFKAKIKLVTPEGFISQEKDG